MGSHQLTYCQLQENVSVFNYSFSKGLLESGICSLIVLHHLLDKAVLGSLLCLPLDHLRSLHSCTGCNHSLTKQPTFGDATTGFGSFLRLAVTADWYPLIIRGISIFFNLGVFILSFKFTLTIQPHLLKRMKVCNNIICFTVIFPRFGQYAEESKTHK